MKVLQIDKYYYLKGGAETVFFNTMDLLEEHGHKVIPFCLKSKKNKPSEYADNFVDFPELSESSFLTRLMRVPSFFYNTESAKKIEILIKKEKPDIAHIHLLFNGISVSILPVLKKYNVPIVMTVHDYRLICPAYTFRKGNGEICERCLHKKNYGQCLKYRCSKGSLINSALLALDMYFRKTFCDPLDYIDNFIFVSKFAQAKHIEADSKYAEKSTFLYNFTPEKQVDLLNKQDYFLYLGRISEEKGIPTLLEAMAKLPHIHLKIAGTGPLLQQFEDRNMTNVEFLGFKEGKVLAKLIREARFVVVPSEWYENNPLSVIEPMMSGTPVIGSQIGGIPELIQEGITGYLFHNGDVEGLSMKIDKAFRLDAAQYIEMCKATRKYAKANFSEDSYYDKLELIYKQTIEVGKK